MENREPVESDTESEAEVENGGQTTAEVYEQVRKLLV